MLDSVSGNADELLLSDSADDEQHSAGFDSLLFWRAVHLAGLVSAQTRILDAMLGPADQGTGTVAIAQDRIAIGAATGNVPKELTRLKAAGWFTIIREPQKVRRLIDGEWGWRWTPTIYQLRIPDSLERSGDARFEASAIASTAGWRSLTANWQTCLGGNDAFRRAEGSLNGAYPVLAVLGETPVPATTLMGWVGRSKRQVRNLTQQLVDHQIAMKTAEGYVLTSGDLLARLDTVACAAGTDGSRDHAIAQYYAHFEDWDAEQATWRSEHEIPGTQSWRKDQAKQFRTQFNSPESEALRIVWGSGSAAPDAVVQAVVEAYLEQLLEPSPAMTGWLKDHREDLLDFDQVLHLASLGSGHV